MGQCDLLSCFAFLRKGSSFPDRFHKSAVAWGRGQLRKLICGSSPALIYVHGVFQFLADSEESRLQGFPLCLSASPLRMQKRDVAAVRCQARARMPALQDRRCGSATCFCALRFCAESGSSRAQPLAPSSSWTAVWFVASLDLPLACAAPGRLGRAAFQSAPIVPSS